MPDVEQPDVPTGKRPRHGSGVTKTPVIEKLDLTAEERPDDQRKSDK